MKGITCPRCKGSGKETWFERCIFYTNLLAGRPDCPLCGGKGIIFVEREDDYE